jgi:hypothetical protein
MIENTHHHFYVLHLLKYRNMKNAGIECHGTWIPTGIENAGNNNRSSLVTPLEKCRIPI